MLQGTAGADYPHAQAFDGKFLAPRVDNNRLELGVLGEKFDDRAAAAQPLHRHLIVKARDHDLPGAGFAGLVHGEQVAIVNAGIAHAHAAHLEQSSRRAD